MDGHVEPRLDENEISDLVEEKKREGGDEHHRSFVAAVKQLYESGVAEKLDAHLAKLGANTVLKP